MRRELHCVIGARMRLEVEDESEVDNPTPA
jgi:hypothetical protein